MRYHEIRPVLPPPRQSGLYRLPPPPPSHQIFSPVLHRKIFLLPSSLSSGCCNSAIASFVSLTYLPKFTPLRPFESQYAKTPFLPECLLTPLSHPPGSLNLSLSQPASYTVLPVYPDPPSLHIYWLQHTHPFFGSFNVSFDLEISYHLLTSLCPVSRWPRSVASSSSLAMVPAVRPVCSCKYSDIRTARSASPLGSSPPFD
jgi:hypothetical protein